MLLFLSIVLFFVVWAIFCIRIVRETERAIVVSLGNPVHRINSGLRFIFWPLQWLVYFPTTIQELNFRRAGIITSKGEYNSVQYGQANIGIDPAMYFRWPDTDEELISALRAIGTTDLQNITDLFEETVLDAFRTVGGGKTWGEITQERKGYAAETRQSLLDEPEDPLKIAAFSDFRLAIKHVELPPGLLESLTKPEIARLEREAAKEQAEAEKIRIIGQGEGIAKARKMLFKAIGDEPANIQKEILLTLREMAQGTSNTILFPIPSKLTDVLEEVFGSSSKGAFDPIQFFKSPAGRKFAEELLKMMGGSKK
jgi:regulator of protease activity HflC (stomatin/prohibitin superfamily)